MYVVAGISRNSCISFLSRLNQNGTTNHLRTCLGDAAQAQVREEIY